MLHNKQFQGFTIVELLVVIVVIGILAAITIVAFNGVTNKARIAAVLASLDGAKQQVEIARTTAGTDTYPGSVAGMDANVVYTTNASLGGYCLVNASISGTPYMVTSTNGVPRVGPSSVASGCIITNLLTNPSFEFNTYNWDRGARAFIDQTTDPTLVNIGNGAGIMKRIDAASGEAYTRTNIATTVGKRYSASFAIKNASGNPATTASIRNLNLGWSLADNATVNITPTAAYVRYTLSWTAQDSTSMLLIENNTTVVNSAVAIDAVMATEGENAGAYMDPDLKPGSGWSWSNPSAQGWSTSSGPAF